MNKLLALLLVLSVSVALSILVIIYGWGLEPKSWGWIVGVGVFMQVFMKIIGGKVMDEKQ